MQKYTVEITHYGTILWYKEGSNILHRENGPALEDANGDKFWYKDGRPHREDGPAIQYADGTKCWCKEGKVHRENGPAKECPDGTKYWYLNDIKYVEDEYNKLIQKNIPEPTCDGKEVIIEGKTYRLTLVDNA